MLSANSAAGARRSWVGVDVGDAERPGAKGFHLALMQTGPLPAVEQIEHRRNVGAAVELLREWMPSVIAIDSPIRPALATRRSRWSEKKLRDAVGCGIRFTPNRDTVESGGAYYGWIRSGWRLYDAIRPGHSWTVLECFPTASFTQIGGKRKRRRRTDWTKEILRGMDGVQLRLHAQPHNQDERDAVIAAYTAYLADRGQVEWLGQIVVPV